MRARATLIVVALLIPPVVSAAQLSLSRPGEQVVEGHTVFTAMTVLDETDGFNLAVKVREVLDRPNVLWFNDQWKTFFREVRQPCGGYVLVTNENIDPLGLFVHGPSATARYWRSQYSESYYVTDPNGYSWITDKYSLFVGLSSYPLWIGSIHNAQMPDDGVSDCPGVIDVAPHRPIGTNGKPYYDNVDGVPLREYNADIYGRWRDARGRGSTSHGEGAPGNSAGTGCEYYTEWQCGPLGTDAEDAAEGNSHPYNPNEPDAGVRHTHSMAKLDVFFVPHFGVGDGSLFEFLGGYPPANRRFTIYDDEAIETDYAPCNDYNDRYHANNNGWHMHCP